MIKFVGHPPGTLDALKQRKALISPEPPQRSGESTRSDVAAESSTLGRVALIRRASWRRARLRDLTPVPANPTHLRDLTPVPVKPFDQGRELAMTHALLLGAVRSSQSQISQGLLRTATRSFLNA